MLTSKKLKQLGVKIPKGWRVIRTGEKLGVIWKYCDSNFEGTRLYSNGFRNPSEIALQSNVNKRLLDYWKHSSIYIKPK